MEERKRVTMISYRCDVCGKGEMLPTGATYRTIPAGQTLFVHKCDKCGQGMNLDRTYPRIADASPPSKGDQP